MADMSEISEELFNKVRSRFKSVKLGDSDGHITNVPSEARFFDIEYTDSGKPLGKISMSITKEYGVTIIYSQDFIKDQPGTIQQRWYDFLREIRRFAKKRMMNFDVRNIKKNSLTRRDYHQIASNSNVSESKLYGSLKNSYQDIGNSRLVINHICEVDPKRPRSRSRKIGSIYIESANGERFRYPYRDLRGARAMARHVSEGGNPYDVFGQHVVEINEESRKLRKFKRHIGKNSVMAESLSGYEDVVNDRINEIKTTLEHIQRLDKYKEYLESFQPSEFPEIPNDVRDNWIDELTIRQFNEELEDIFPYMYRLINKGVNMTKKLSPMDLEEQLIMNEAGVNFTTSDIEKMMSMPLEDAKQMATDIIEKSSMKSEKIAYFKNQINRKNTPIALGKMFYDMLLSGEGMGVIGSRGSTKKSRYRDKFSESSNAKSISRAVMREFDTSSKQFKSGAMTRLRENYGHSSLPLVFKFMSEIEQLSESRSKQAVKNRITESKSRPTTKNDITESVDQDIIRLAGLK